ncbi:TPA: metal-binding protein [Candidatus Woesearchaeota archaeon]|nr:metal-binding protein [Candidatus Woesearchaeota archaeon]
MDKQYRILKDGTVFMSATPGEYAGWRHGKIFGRLDCESGKRLIQPKNRVFFATLEDAIREGYRPCQKCKPMDENDFAGIRALVTYTTLEEFYNRDKRPKR